jgi:hypothetical protein
MIEARQKDEQEYVAAAAEGLQRDDNTAFVAMDALGSTLIAEFQQAVQDRQPTEQRWLKDLRQYKGIYDPEIEARIGANRSKAFVRATRVKVKTVDARVADLLFPSSTERNWTAEPTPMPSIDRVSKKTIFAALAQQLGRAPDQRELDEGVRKFVGAAADRMTSIMDDQLTEARYRETARDVLHSGHLYGTGVLKAPLVERKTRDKFVLEGGRWVMKSESYVVPFVDYVPLWRFYPDMSATKLEDCNYVYELHLFTRNQIAGLSRRKSFKAQKIRDYILSNPKGAQTTTSSTYENEIRDIGERTNARINHDGKYEVIERWGYLTGEQLASIGVTVPPERMHETFFANTWILPNGEVIKCVLAPLNGVTYPYHLYYCDKDETSIFGEGFASIMRDDQTTINAATRMVLDHAAITAGPQFEVNMKLMAPSERADDMYPFKIWKRSGDDAASPAIRVLNVPLGLEELMPIVEMFQRNADDVTAIPRYMQGQNATSGAAGTASGMSMLMANASVVMKDLLTNYDAVTRTFISALYKWNMQFNPDNACKGDFDIKARGTASLMAKEIRAQQLDQFAATISPDDAPYIKREELLRQRAQAHDLTSIIKSEEEVLADQNSAAAKQQAELGQQMQQLQLQLAQANLSKVVGEVKRLEADVERLRAIATKTNVDAAYAGMQAGGVATERPEVAPAGDAILKSAGFVDHTPQDPAAPVGSAPAQVAPAPGAVDPAQATVDPTQAAANNSDPEVPATGAPPDLPDPSVQADPQGAQVGANVGEQAGIETPRIEA